MSADKDWNAIFAEQMEERNRERRLKLSRAKVTAPSGKERFDRKRFRALYEKLYPDDVDRYTPWDTLLEESEYDYYVSHPEILTLAAYIEHQKWLDGFA